MKHPQLSIRENAIWKLYNDGWSCIELAQLLNETEEDIHDTVTDLTVRLEKLEKLLKVE